MHENDQYFMSDVVEIPIATDISQISNTQDPRKSHQFCLDLHEKRKQFLSKETVQHKLIKADIQEVHHNGVHSNIHNYEMTTNPRNTPFFSLHGPYYDDIAKYFDPRRTKSYDILGETIYQNQVFLDISEEIPATNDMIFENIISHFEIPTSTELLPILLTDQDNTIEDGELTRTLNNSVVTGTVEESKPSDCLKSDETDLYRDFLLDILLTQNPIRLKSTLKSSSLVQMILNDVKISKCSPKESNDDPIPNSFIEEKSLLGNKSLISSETPKIGTSSKTAAALRLATDPENSFVDELKGSWEPKSSSTPNPKINVFKRNPIGKSESMLKALCKQKIHCNQTVESTRDNHALDKKIDSKIVDSKFNNNDTDQFIKKTDLEACMVVDNDLIDKMSFSSGSDTEPMRDETKDNNANGQFSNETTSDITKEQYDNTDKASLSRVKSSTDPNDDSTNALVNINQNLVIEDEQLLLKSSSKELIQIIDVPETTVVDGAAKAQELLPTNDSNTTAKTAETTNTTYKNLSEESKNNACEVKKIETVITANKTSSDESKNRISELKKMEVGLEKNDLIQINEKGNLNTKMNTSGSLKPQINTGDSLEAQMDTGDSLDINNSQKDTSDAIATGIGDGAIDCGSLSSELFKNSSECVAASADSEVNVNNELSSAQAMVTLTSGVVSGFSSSTASATIPAKTPVNATIHENTTASGTIPSKNTVNATLPIKSDVSVVIPTVSSDGNQPIVDVTDETQTDTDDIIVTEMNTPNVTQSVICNTEDVTNSSGASVVKIVNESCVKRKSSLQNSNSELLNGKGVGTTSASTNRSDFTDTFTSRSAGNKEYPKIPAVIEITNSKKDLVKNKKIQRMLYSRQVDKAAELVFFNLLRDLYKTNTALNPFIKVSKRPGVCTTPRLSKRLEMFDSDIENGTNNLDEYIRACKNKKPCGSSLLETSLLSIRSLKGMPDQISEKSPPTPTRTMETPGPSTVESTNSIPISDPIRDPISDAISDQDEKLRRLSVKDREIALYLSKFCTCWVEERKHSGCVESYGAFLVIINNRYPAPLDMSTINSALSVLIKLTRAHPRPTSSIIQPNSSSDGTLKSLSDNIFLRLALFSAELLKILTVEMNGVLDVT